MKKMVFIAVSMLLLGTFAKPVFASQDKEKKDPQIEALKELEKINGELTNIREKLKSILDTKKPIIWERDEFEKKTFHAKIVITSFFYINYKKLDKIVRKMEDIAAITDEIGTSKCVNAGSVVSLGYNFDNLAKKISDMSLVNWQKKYALVLEKISKNEMIDMNTIIDNLVNFIEEAKQVKRNEQIQKDTQATLDEKYIPETDAFSKQGKSS